MGKKIFWYDDIKSVCKKTKGFYIMRLISVILIIAGVIGTVSMTKFQNIYIQLLPFIFLLTGIQLIIYSAQISPSMYKRWLIICDEQGGLWIADIFSDIFLRAFGLTDCKIEFKAHYSNATSLASFVSDRRKYIKLQKEVIQRNIPELLLVNPSRAAVPILKVSKITDGKWYYEVVLEIKNGIRALKLRIYSDMKGYDELAYILENNYKDNEVRLCSKCGAKLVNGICPNCWRYEEEKKKKLDTRKILSNTLIILSPVSFILSFVASIELHILILNLALFFGAFFVLYIGIKISKEK